MFKKFGYKINSDLLKNRQKMSIFKWRKLGWFGIKVGDQLRKRRLSIQNYNDENRSSVIDLINWINTTPTYICGLLSEGYTIYSLAKATEKIKGDIAEVGVYHGGSARIIAEAKGNKTLHLFDTFTKIPDSIPEFDEDRISSDFSGVDLELIKREFKEYPNVHFYKGLFPQETSKFIKGKKFCFVNLDVDLYQSTLDALEFFYPRMNKGGIILTHDYIGRRVVGVKKAFDKFLKDKPEVVIELTGTQALFVKL